MPTAVAGVNQSNASNCPSGVTASACKTLTITAGGSYLISTGFGQVGPGMAEYHRQLVAKALASGNGDLSEPALGESLAVIGYGWLAENASAQRMIDRLSGTTALYHFGVGIAGQRQIQNSQAQGPYVDLPINSVSVQPQTSNGPTVTIGGDSYPAAMLASFFTDAHDGSSLESAILEQTQASVPGMVAASTVRLVDVNMDPAQGYSGKTYFADGTTAAGQQAFTTTILPAIRPYYGSADLSAIQADVSAGQQVLIPGRGAITVGLWLGAGYVTITPGSGDAITVGHFISGGMSGGMSGTDVPNVSYTTPQSVTPAANSDSISSWLNVIASTLSQVVSDPVDGVTGSYVYRHDDLATGGGDFPYALRFGRTYQAAAGTSLTTGSANKVMGPGWGHNYGASARVDSDPYASLGSAATTPAANAVNAIAAFTVMQDLLSVTPTAQTLTVTALAARWLTDRLTGNVVQIVWADTTEQFVALPYADGATTAAYTPPPASPARLVASAPDQSGAFTSFSDTTPDGVVSTFGPTPAGALQAITFPTGMTVSLSYSGTQLSQVANTLGRTLNVTYANGCISGVRDDSGRSVGYTYDASGNLVGFTDAAGASTRYAYDSTGVYDSLGHLTQIFYPTQPGAAFVTNWYDALGRVVQQANANGAVSNLYFAGSRTEIVDALGDRRVTYQDERGLVMTAASVLDSNLGPVFSDTPQSDGAVDVTTKAYDELGRQVSTTLPGGDGSVIAYDGVVNPWANNLASVTRTPKPGSGLAPLVTRYTSDPTWNKPVSATDPRGTVGLNTYDRVTGALVETVADWGSGHVNATRRFAYDPHGLPVSATDPLGVVTSNSHDGSGNLVTRVSDAGSGGLNVTTRLSYDPVGDVTVQTDPNGNRTTMGYDAARRPVSVTAPTGLITTTAYDPDGRPLSVTRTGGGLRASPAGAATP